MQIKNLKTLHVSKEEGRAEARPYNNRTTTLRRQRPYGGGAKSEQTRTVDGAQVWKEFEDLVVPRLRLSVFERAAYSHLLRHTRLEGKLRLCFSIGWLARGANLSERGARRAVLGLAAKGALRLGGRSRVGHAVAVRLPEEIRAVRRGRIAKGDGAQPKEVDPEKADFLQTAARREAIHEREGGLCFYCMRRLKRITRCLDHVVPLVMMGDNSYRNLVSSCMECNTQKGKRRAEDFLRGIYREGRLSATELTGRLRALRALAAGKVRPRNGGS